MTDTEMATAAADHAALRQRVRDIQAGERLNQKQLATESGIAYGTFTNWLGGTYEGDLDKLGARVLTWLESRPKRSRVQASMPDAPGFTETPSAELFMTTLEHAQYMPDMVLVIGAPGLGKTMAATRYQSRNPNVWMVTAEPCGGSARSLLELIAGSMGFATAGVSAPRLSSEIARKVRGSKALLVIDEAQHLLPMALDQLRTLHDAAGCGVGLVGNETIVARISGGGRTHFAQLTSRVGMRIQRLRPMPADVGTLLDAWGVEDREQRGTLNAIAQKPGTLRLMTKALRLAHKLASADGSELLHTHIQASWARLSNNEDLGRGKGAEA
jgi:DNA transposition AAA+ family ATPase